MCLSSPSAPDPPKLPPMPDEISDEAIKKATELRMLQAQARAGREDLFIDPAPKNATGLVIG